MTVKGVSIALGAVYSLAWVIPEKGDGGELPIGGKILKCQM